MCIRLLLRLLLMNALCGESGAKKDPSEMISQYYIPENETTIMELKRELVRLRNYYHCPPTITLRNMNKQASWPYEKRTKPL